MKAITILWVILLVFPSVYGGSLSNFCFNSQTIPIELNLSPNTYHIQIGSDVREFVVEDSSILNVLFNPKKIGVHTIKLKVLETNEVIKTKFNVQECILLDLPSSININSSTMEVQVENLGENTSILIGSLPFKSEISSMVLGFNETKSFNIDLPTNLDNKKIEQTVFIKVGDRIIKESTILIFGTPFPYKLISFLILFSIFAIFLIPFLIPNSIVSRKTKQLIKKFDNRINHSKNKNKNK